MNPTNPECQVIGAGRAGNALSRAMALAGYRFSWVLSRQACDAETLASRIGAGHFGTAVDSSSGCTGFLVIAVPDGEIAGVALKVAESGLIAPNVTVAAHLSGALDSGVLDPLRIRGASVMAFHPAQSFTGESDPAAVFKGVCFDMEGDDAAMELGEHIARDLGASSVRLTPGQRVVTHLAMTAASNYTVSLLSVALNLVESAGVTGDRARSMIEPLLRTTVDNVFTYGVVKALTGPVSRGDAAIVKRHLDILAGQDRDYYDAYRALASIALRIAVDRGDLDKGAVERLEKMLHENG